MALMHIALIQMPVRHVAVGMCVAVGISAPMGMFTDVCMRLLYKPMTKGSAIQYVARAIVNQERLV